MAVHDEMCRDAKALMQIKNQDYGANHDPFRNFREFGLFGILVRLSDKMARIRTFLERGELSVKDESVTDTIRDGINYLILFEGLRRDEAEEEKKAV